MRFELPGCKAYLYISCLNLLQNLRTSYLQGYEIRRLRRILTNVDEDLRTIVATRTAPHNVYH